MSEQPKPLDAEDQACMDYLHGDVPEDQQEAACFYEYCRRSMVLRKLAEIRTALTKQTDVVPKTPFYRTVFDERISMASVRELAESGLPGTKHIWFWQDRWSYLWQQCRSFFHKTWSSMAESERNYLRSFFGTSEVKPLTSHPTWLYNSMTKIGRPKGVFAAMIKKAKEAIEIREDLPLKPDDVDAEALKRKERPEIQDDNFLHCMFTIDFTKRKKRLCKEFEAWLGLPENRERLKKYERNLIGTSGGPLDRLKDLAVWKLYEKYRYQGMLDFTEKNRKRDENGNPRPYHDERQGQSSKVPLNEAPLFSEESSALKAIGRAKAFLAELIPWEFGKHDESPMHSWIQEHGMKLPKTMDSEKPEQPESKPFEPKTCSVIARTPVDKVQEWINKDLESNPVIPPEPSKPGEKRSLGPNDESECGAGT